MKLFGDFTEYWSCCFYHFFHYDTRSAFEIEEGNSWQGIEESTCPDELRDGQYGDPLQKDDDFDAIIDTYNNAEGEMPTTSFEAESKDEGEEDGEDTLDETSPFATQQSSAPDIQSELLTGTRILAILLLLWDCGVKR